MDIGIRTRQIANAYYNRGLTKAKNRDLTGAAEALKQSLRFDKYLTSARNLLGLIYNETGEVGAAMVQWIISLNLQEKENIAEEYLRTLHASRGYLELADQAAKKYNQALVYARTDNADLAILLLMRMLEEFPQYVKAQELLALLYIDHEDFAKAGRCLYHASRIDCYNPTIQRYMSIAKRNTGRAEVERKKLKNAFSHRQMQDDDIIIPPSYKENTGWQSVLNILTGLILGTVAAVFLIMPASREMLNRKHNEEVRANLEMINQKNIEIDSLNHDLQEARQGEQQAEESLQALTDDNGGTIRQYENLVQILDYLKQEKLLEAALLYVDTDWAVLQADEALKEILAQVYQEMSVNGCQVLEQKGDEAMQEQNGYKKAIDYYQKSLFIRADNTAVIYKIGLAFKAQGDTDSANQYFGNIIMNYPNSEYAPQAKEQRGY